MFRRQLLPKAVYSSFGLIANSAESVCCFVGSMEWSRPELLSNKMHDTIFSWSNKQNYQCSYKGRRSRKNSQAAFCNLRTTLLVPPYFGLRKYFPKTFNCSISLGYWLSLVAPALAWLSPVASQLQLSLGIFFEKETQNKPWKQTVNNTNRSQKEPHIILKPLLAINGIIT